MTATAMTGDDVRAALGELTDVLAPLTRSDAARWDAPAGPLEWSCRETAAHIAHDLLAYAGQLAARPADRYLPFDLTVPPDAGPAEVLTVVTACARLLATALDAAPPGLRAWHHGPCDPAGFAAMGVTETLLHTHDITLGLGVDWRPSERLCRAALARLFPDAPEAAAGRAADVLLWCTGRGELDGRPRRTSWSWRAAVA
ncbi:maleylpyruvate isomerase N-terminal domain-containing protein [Kitasatospora sp. NBC_00458]|uniref:maleylpyruvate isomerase N-terminal domain-containing protein n=1 Tax=Kitasatospora sp. NBC_00458 TaxID=2903568 RepID=UPI002E17E405